MLRALLRNTEFGQVLSFVSPALFDVMPLNAMFGETKQLLRSSADARSFQQICQQLSQRIAQSDFGITLRPTSAASGQFELARLPERERKDVGQRLLWLYFYQLFNVDETLLDIRPKTLSYEPSSKQITWQPATLFKIWDPMFLAALRRLYRGFYLDDSELFDSAADELNLTGAKQQIYSHFGAGSQGEVIFTMRHFVSSFQQVFLRCKEGRARLHPNFLALGFYLAGLYESLELLGQSFNVRAAFERATADEG